MTETSLVPKPAAQRAHVFDELVPMDGRGGLARRLKWVGRLRPRRTSAGAAGPRKRARAAARREAVSRLKWIVQRRLAPVLGFRPRRGAGLAAAGLIVFGSIAAGVIKGGHVDTFVAALADARDAAANAAGFRIASVALTGRKQVTREEILATAGVTGRSSLLFLDVDRARERLKTNPWIADATVLKLYPDRLKIGVTEREAFALWQKDGRVSVIARDGTVLEPYVANRFARLPLVVGQGAEARAETFLATLDRFPHIRAQVRASVLVAERRWNLRLRNGIDVRLPEADPAAALERLVALDREKKLIARDIVAIDLRLPDRVVVQLSGAAAQARVDALKDKARKKGNDA